MFPKVFHPLRDISLPFPSDQKRNDLTNMKDFNQQYGHQDHLGTVLPLFGTVLLICFFKVLGRSYF